MAGCTHFGHVAITELPHSSVGCEECLAIGSGWVHLRICLEFGHVGCCDSSPNRHASAHHAQTGHPLVRSLEPGEQWSWCYEDQVVLFLPQVKGRTAIPPSPMLGPG